MKTMKKLMALTLAFVMAMALAIPTMAAGETGARTLDSSISVTGLKDGDSVAFYKVLKWDGNWAVNSPFALSDGEFTAVVSDGEINAALAGKLGGQATGSAKYTVVESDGSAVVNNPEAGLYICIITPGGTGYTYNPVFVAADYNSNSSNTIAIPGDGVLSYSDKAMAKYNELNLEKVGSDGTTQDANNTESVAAGDTLTFRITTTIPGFADNYTAPVFNVSDTLNGLTLNEGSITVVKPTGAGVVYEVTGKSATGFTVEFDSDYLKTVKTATPVVITYTAVVNDSPNDKNVNLKTNDVTVNYSNSPSDTTGHGKLTDGTKHYTFTIDGNLLGSDGYGLTEVVKVGIDKNGNEITKTTTLDNGNTVGALQGAEFTLYANEACTKVYSCGSFDGTVTSGSDGRINISGIDAGKYWLKETKAPDGYVKAQDAVSIEIIPVFSDGTFTNSDGTYTATYLVSYTVKINNVETASFTVTNDAEGNATETTAGDTVVGTDDDSGKIKNTQGVELPSTGGIGTKIFYALGAVLVVGAGVVLVSRKRALD